MVVSRFMRFGAWILNKCYGIMQRMGFVNVFVTGEEMLSFFTSSFTFSHTHTAYLMLPSFDGFWSMMLRWSHWKVISISAVARISLVTCYSILPHRRAVHMFFTFFLTVCICGFMQMKWHEHWATSQAVAMLVV